MVAYFPNAALSLALLLVPLSAVLTSVPAAAAASRFSDLKGNPDLRSASALVLDAQGNVIYGKDADTVRPIASITKLMTAMVVLDAGLDLDEKISVSEADRDRVQMTGSRLAEGATLSRREMIQLAIISSENRAAAALGRNYPGGTTAFVAQMNAKAAELGMSRSRFADPVGLRVENQSTARELGRMISAAQLYPLIHEASTTRQLQVRPFRDRGPLNYVNTNRLLKNASWDIALSKTGYLNESGRCLVMQAKIEGEPVSIVLLNSFGKLTPFGDSNRLRKWMVVGR
jgi:D-alanyl-D-alanine endopeptidase (penicillin-binding protein 7)